MAVRLSDHFNYRKLFRAVLPSIFMMLFTSVYSIVDGLFVSNFVGKTAFATVNFVMPVLMAIGAVGFMFGAGGGALVAKTLGEGDREKANKIFSSVIYFNLIVGAVLSVAGIFFIGPLSAALGATEEMLPNCTLYGRVLIGTSFVYMLQSNFQNFFIVAEKPMLGFLVTVLAGVMNMILDAVFVVLCKWGLTGAAVATAMSYLVGGAVPVFYFALKNKSLLRLVKTRFLFGEIGRSCVNGSSELLTNVSSSIVSVLFNVQLLRFAGEDGVAAYGVLMYALFIFASVFIGYSIGVAPIVGYHYGANHSSELSNLLKKSLVVVSVAGAVMTAILEGLARPLSSVFVGYDPSLLDLTTRAMRLYSFCFLITGINMFASSYFTALNNGLVSAVVSFSRTLVFQVACVLVMPVFLQLDGVWLSVVAAEFLGVIVTAVCLVVMRKKYRY